MSIPASGSPEDCAFEAGEIPAVQAAQQTPVPSISLLSIPRELRDMIYAFLFEAIYTQYRRTLQLPITRPGCARITPEAKTSDRLAIMQTCRKLWNEGSMILYSQHLFRFHIGSIPSIATLLTERTADLMQNIEISLGPSQFPDSARFVRLFGFSEILRESCLIKLEHRKPELIDHDAIEALRQLIGFEILTLEVDAPAIVRYGESGTPIPWVSGLLAFMQVQLALALGPSIYANIDGYRRLIFNPQLYRRQFGVKREKRNP